MDKQDEAPGSPAGSPAGSRGSAIDPAHDLEIKLAHGLEIKDVEEAHATLSTALEKGVALTIDVTHVAAIDTAGVQLLLALRVAAAKRGTPLNFTGHSAPFNHALKALGLHGAFAMTDTRG